MLAGICPTNEKPKNPQIYFVRTTIAGKRNLGNPQLRYRDVCKRDMNELNIDLNKWEELAMDRSWRRSYLQTALKVAKKI